MITLAPWANGPFELIVHAEEHLRNGDDFDRRIALISFDDAIEVAITTYLTLHPIQRNNRTYPKEDVAKWLQNYHSRLDFLQGELAARALIWQVEQAYIVYVHENRNTQYHSAKAGTPEHDTLKIARKAALWIFGVLFEVKDAESILDERIKAKAPPPVPLRRRDWDKAIDTALDGVGFGDALYSASELLYCTDYDAYRDLGTSLLEEYEQSAKEKTA